jgi:hypothetical protein
VWVISQEWLLKKLRMVYVQVVVDREGVRDQEHLDVVQQRLLNDLVLLLIVVYH